MDSTTRDEVSPGSTAGGVGESDHSVPTVSCTPARGQTVVPVSAGYKQHEDQGRPTVTNLSRLIFS